MFKKNKSKGLIIFINIIFTNIIFTNILLAFVIGILFLSSCKKEVRQIPILIENGYKTSRNADGQYYYKETMTSSEIDENLTNINNIFNKYGYRNEIYNNYVFTFIDEINSKKDLGFLNNGKYQQLLEQEKIILLSSLDFTLEEKELFLKIINQTNLKKYNYFSVNILANVKSDDVNILKTIDKIKNEDYFTEIIIFNPVFLIGYNHFEEDYKDYEALCINFSEFLLLKNKNIISDILRNEENTEKIEINYKNWLLKNNIKEEYILSKKTAAVNYNNYEIHTEEKNILRIKKDVLYNEKKIFVKSKLNYYLVFLNEIDEKITTTKNFLKGANTNISEKTPVTTIISSGDNYTIRMDNTIFLGETGVTNSFLHELTHLFLEVEEKSFINQANDPFKYVYEEGIAEYVEFLFSNNNMDFINENYFNFLNSEYPNNLKVRNTILAEYLKKEKSIDVNTAYINADTYIDSCAYLALTNEEFLYSYKAFKNIYDTEKPALNSYEESVSFVKFIIENYGKDSFFQLQKRNKSYEEIFNKSYVTILLEWLDYLGVDGEKNILSKQGKIKNYKNNLS